MLHKTFKVIDKKEESALFQKLTRNDYHKVASLVVNSHHELCIEAVIKGTSTGEIYVDDVVKPQSVLFLTPECNLVAGYAGNPEFNERVKKKLDFWEDPIMCDTEEWEHRIGDIHRNIAIKKYTRRYYQLSKPYLGNFMGLLRGGYTVEYVSAANTDYLQYDNAEHVTNWFNFTDINDFEGYCLGAYVRTDTKIVSWCLVDCIVDDKMEIGVTTHPEYRRQGLATVAAAATVNRAISNGMRQIGWHCVDSNIGSYTVAEQVGFAHVKDYSSFTPYPPIENITDLDDEQWAEWGNHYDEMNKIDPIYHWQAAQCWALAHNPSNTIRNVKHLWTIGQTVDRETLLEQCAHLEGDEEWEGFVSTLVWG